MKHNLFMRHDRIPHFRFMWSRPVTLSNCTSSISRLFFLSLERVQYLPYFKCALAGVLELLPSDSGLREL